MTAYAVTAVWIRYEKQRDFSPFHYQSSDILPGLKAGDSG